MKFKYTNKSANEPVRSYGQLLANGDTVDSSVWGDKEAHFISKALSNPDYEVVQESKKAEPKKEPSIYETMTGKELVAALQLAEIEIPKGSKKADLVALAETNAEKLNIGSQGE